jgi:hypothetical protein
VSTYLGRLVDRAVGPPASAVTPRLAPVFPLGGAPQSQPEPLTAETAPEPSVGHDARPAASTDDVLERSVRVTPSRAVRELHEVHVERPAHEPREPVAGEAPAPATEQPRTEIRTHERTVERSLAPREVEQAQPAKAAALATPREKRQPVPVGTQDQTPAPEPPRIEVRIGRVEVRPPPEPETVEWPAPAARPAARGFGELAASRRYVDRRWS